MGSLRCSQCPVKCGSHYVPYHVLRLLRMGFRKFQDYDDKKSLLKRHLTEKMLEYLKFRVTVNNVNLYDCIRTGLEQQDAEIGIYACDPQSYFIFSPIFFPILEEIHNFYPDKIHPKSNWLPIHLVSNFETKKQYIRMIEITVSRNLIGYPFCYQMTPHQFQKIEDYLEMILALMTGNYDGTYEKIANLSVEREKELIQKNLIFDNKDKVLKTAGIYSYWPTGRGAFFNSAEDFIVWVNQENHLKIITRETGGNLRQAFEKTMKALRILKRDLYFVMSKRLGYVTFNPADMGTGMRMKIQLVLPRTGKRIEALQSKAKAFDLHIELVSSEDNVWNLWNKKTLGLTELDIASKFGLAVEDFIDAEDMPLID